MSSPEKQNRKGEQQEAETQQANEKQTNIYAIKRKWKKVQAKQEAKFAAAALGV